MLTLVVESSEVFRLDTLTFFGIIACNYNVARKRGLGIRPCHWKGKVGSLYWRSYILTPVDWFGALILVFRSTAIVIVCDLLFCAFQNIQHLIVPEFLP